MPRTVTRISSIDRRALLTKAAPVVFLRVSGSWRLACDARLRLDEANERAIARVWPTVSGFGHRGLAFDTDRDAGATGLSGLALLPLERIVTGRLAQLARASLLQSEGHWFEPSSAH